VTAGGDRPEQADPGTAPPPPVIPQARRTGPPLVRTVDLSVRFEARGRLRREARAVDGVNLDIAKGEIVALVGESGCGKTTLARTILGLERPTAGQVLYQGKPLSYRSSALRDYRRAVQLVLQDPTGSLNPRHTVYEAIAEGVRIHKLDNELARVTDALARCGLRPPERFFQRYPHEMSGGQRQRVVIAGALVLEPTVLVADEPVASLDASVRGEILALLLKLRADLGLAALVVTHDLGLAWNIADRLAVMYLGRIVEVGTPEQVFADPRHPYTRALMSVLPESPMQPIVLTGEPPDPTMIPSGCRFNPRCQELASGAAAEAGVAADCTSRPLEVLPAAPESERYGHVQPLVACYLADARMAAAGPDGQAGPAVAAANAAGADAAG
jgi:peptide/nickel transport system ATP-binding protein